ncbi:MAG: hypothetical protein J6Y02_12355 [Pseudobutyrivibrio sp.]|nr:hypothetical protein [Pseudobutyrivibrio sp.]
MNFNQHSNLEGTHAIFSASKYHWLNYSDEKMLESLNNMRAAERGTRLHAFAAEAINLRRRQKGTDYFSNYVNDAIGFGMTPEVILYFNDWFYGQTDAIKFDEKKAFLRIHDLKNCESKTHMEQLMIYAAYFCLEYHIKPGDIQMELRIYQQPNKYDPELRVFEPTASDIAPIMDKVIHTTKLIREKDI